MALIKLSAIALTAISGTTGGTTFSFNRGGKYTRNWAKPTNPQTAKQTMMRSIFGFVSQLWGTLSQEQVDLWNAAGENQERTNAIGEQHAMTGFTYFKAVNQNRLHSGWDTPLLTPPAILPIPAVISQVFDYSNTIAKTLVLTLGDTVDSGLYIASVGWSIVSANQNRNYGSVKNKFSNRVRMPIPAGNTIDLSSVLPDLTYGQTLYFQLHIHSADGQKGPEVTGRAQYDGAVVLTATPSNVDSTTGGSSVISVQIGTAPSIISLLPGTFDILPVDEYAGVAVDNSTATVTFDPMTPADTYGFNIIYQDAFIGVATIDVTP